MMRTNAAATLGAALLISFAGVAGAQAPQTQQGQSVKPRAEQGMGRRFDRGFHRGRFGRGFGGGFVKDLNLTDVQKARIKAIHEKYRPQLQAIRTQFKSQLDNARALRQKGDTAGARAAFQKTRGEIQQRVMTLRQQEQADIRNVLTAEQRAKFDARQAEMKKRMEERQKNGALHGRGGKYGRGSQKG